MKKIIVLGAGMVGRAIALDLSKDFEVSSVDLDINNLNELNANNKINTIQADVTDKKKLQRIICDFDFVIGAVPGNLGFETLKTVIEAEKNIVDISFFPEDAFKLDDLAKKKDVTAIVDCGVAPGMSNLILGYHNKKMKVERFECIVGGLPFARHFPFQYKAPFSPVDVLEEYTRPARYVENGFIVTKPALSDVELVDFPEVGTLESFNSDGLRSILFTIKTPNMKEKTLRYPGHSEYIRVLKDSGFFDNSPIVINGHGISPMEFTSKILFKKWKLEKEEPEFTIMQIIVEGIENEKKIQYTYNLFDKFDESTKISSMARTTGYACTSVANLVISGDFSGKGIIPPEYIGESETSFNAIISYQRERNINYKLKVKDNY